MKNYLFFFPASPILLSELNVGMSCTIFSVLTEFESGHKMQQPVKSGNL